MAPKTKHEDKVVLTLEEVIRKQFLAKCRFKAVVRFVIRNLYWLRDDEVELGDDVKKNIYLITRKKTSKELSLRDKSIMNTPNKYRTEEEKIHLNRVIGGLKCFRIYPAHVKSKLAGATYFVYYPPGRVIVREDDPGDSLYFIITGQVVVSKKEYDPGLECYVDKEIICRESGDMFGEVSLLHGIPRSATITTLTHCELLRLKKKDFDVVLKSSLEEQWQKIKKAMSMFTYFSEWNVITIRKACLMGKMLRFNPQEVVLGDGVGHLDYVYFIIKGQCRIIHHLYIRTIKTDRGEIYKLYVPCKNDNDSTPNIMVASTRKSKTASLSLDIKLPPDVKMHFVEVCFLNTTACFNIGENLNQKRIVAVTHTECLIIPRYWLIKKNSGNIWNKIINFLNSQIPDNNEVFKQFLLQKKWLAYRKSLVNDILSRKKGISGCRYSDVPYSIRINNN